MIPVKDPLCPLVLSDWMVKPYKSLVPLRTQRSANVSFMEYVRSVFLRPGNHQHPKRHPYKQGFGEVKFYER